MWIQGGRGGLLQKGRIPLLNSLIERKQVVARKNFHHEGHEGHEVEIKLYPIGPSTLLRIMSLSTTLCPRQAAGLLNK